MGVISDALQANLRALAQSDARMFRELDEIDRSLRSLAKGADAPQLPESGSQIKAAIKLLEAHGYTVTRP